MDRIAGTHGAFARFACAVLSLCLALAVCGCSTSSGGDSAATGTTHQSATAGGGAADNASGAGDGSSTGGASGTEGAFSYDQVPAFDGSASVEMNGNVPYFSASEIQHAMDNPGFEAYGAQDGLARCAAAWASVGAETMPAEGEERGEIGQIKPTGWQTAKYDSIPGKYLYNRCHLLGWQLTDENANIDNLITGTRFMNVDGMLPHEDDVAAYVKRTGNHVLYRVTPVFLDDELVARGVLMEAYSVEDGGAGLRFCYWCYNAQPGISIDYVDGNSSEMAALPAAGESSGSVASDAGSAESQTRSYVLNASTGKFHLPGCSQVKKMKDANRSEVESTREGMIADGYSPCAVCNP